MGCCARGPVVQFPAPTWQLTTICYSSSKGSDNLFWSLWAPDMQVVNRHKSKQKTHKHKIIFKLRLLLQDSFISILCVYCLLVWVCTCECSTSEASRGHWIPRRWSDNCVLPDTGAGIWTQVLGEEQQESFTSEPSQPLLVFLCSVLTVWWTFLHTWQHIFFHSLII